MVGPFSQILLSYFIFFHIILDIIRKILNCLFRKDLRIFLPRYESVFKIQLCYSQCCCQYWKMYTYLSNNPSGQKLNRMVKGINKTGLVLLEPFVFFCVFSEQRGWSRCSSEVSSDLGYSGILQATPEAGQCRLCWFCTAPSYWRAVASCHCCYLDCFYLLYHCFIPVLWSKWENVSNNGKETRLAALYFSAPMRASVFHLEWHYSVRLSFVL